MRRADRGQRQPCMESTMTDKDIGFVAGSAVTTMMFILIVFFFSQAGVFDNEPIPLCEEDEVYAWQHRPADYPSNITWECVPWDNLDAIMRSE